MSSCDVLVVGGTHGNEVNMLLGCSINGNVTQICWMSPDSPSSV